MKLTKKELKALPRNERKQAKRVMKEQKFSDPYGIDDMSDEEFMKVSDKLMHKARGRSVGGVVLMILAILVLALSWGYIT